MKERGEELRTLRLFVDGVAVGSVRRRFEDGFCGLELRLSERLISA